MALDENAKTGLIATGDVVVQAREVDFVTRFARNWEHLQAIMGVSRMVRKAPGTVLKYKYAAIKTSLAESPDEGGEIPYTKFEVKERPFGDMDIEKYAKAVSLEAIKDHGYDVAVQLTDDEFLAELQNTITETFYGFLTTNATHLTETANTFQLALAKAKGLVVNKWKSMHRTATDVVAFVNVMDVYNYLGTAPITVQSSFGVDYIENFMGYKTIILLSDEELASGTVLATPAENINIYYVDPSDSDFAKAGLVYTTAGETNLIGFHTQGNYSTAVSEAFAIMGVMMFAEYVDGIAKVTIQAPQE